MSIQNMRPEEVHAIRTQGATIDLIDVRSEGEYAAIHAEGACNLPIGRLSLEALSAVRKTPASEPVYVICQSGGRSSAACGKLDAAGVTNIVNVLGGTSAWDKAGLPVVRGRGARIEPFIRPAAIAGMLLGLVLAFTVHLGFLAMTAVIFLAMSVSGRCPITSCILARRQCATKTACAPQCCTTKQS